MKRASEIIENMRSLPEIEELRATVRQAVEKRLGTVKPCVDPRDSSKALQGLRKQGAV